MTHTTTTTFSTTQQVSINAPAARVWEALTTPAIVSRFMFGAEVESTWQTGGPIVYRGVWEGQPYEDRGTIREAVPGRRLSTVTLNSLSGLDDDPENHIVITYALAPDGDARTTLSVTQDNNPSREAADLAGDNWVMTLAVIKQLVEAH